MSLVQIGSQARRPPWLRVRVRETGTFAEVRSLLQGLNLNTVCEDARCPNIWECWGEHRTATFMILGDVCTRACRYCSVESGRPAGPPDPGEPERVAQAVQRLGLKHAVVTSVDRDDLSDSGAGHFVATIAAIRRINPGTKVEVLIPDCQGDGAALNAIFNAGPDVLAHNTETVPRLFGRMRSRGIYARTLAVLERAHHHRQSGGINMTTKSGIMVGLGETLDEVRAVMRDLRAIECDVLTIGQYLNPTRKHTQVMRHVAPEEFAQMKTEAQAMGFAHCESGPLVRSSYHAHEHVAAKAATALDPG
jgi:lipoic acid synthetase